ncbi:progranulin [Calypte anna]|uniref:progranulin n=1 Tax=Calypte anna TaxID=9244 RepID=UPI0011C3C228|nr:progranulin [Calypte anna]
MRTLVLCLTLAGVGALLPCPGGQPCPPTPVLSPQASCPLPEDVPCAGSHHCCPRGSHCSPDGQSCLVSPAPRAIPCPDGQSECPDDATCCVTASGAWGCCPMPQASCCADKVHCCPHDTICDLAHERCLSLTGDNGTATPLGTIFPSWKRQPPAPVALGKVPCPDGRSACPEGATCCHLPSEQYGCCPLQNAVCCSDGQHCCPQGTACDLEHSTCTSTGTPTPLPKAGDVKCDDQTSCPDGSTCCRLSTGAWGCCPLEQAVCCPDHVHCCPQGYICDPAGGSCLQQGGGRRPWLRKIPAVTRGGDVKCDEKMSCPQGSTCCQLSSGAWGCCPLEQATCCRDHLHCCPRGYTCNLAEGSCEKLLTPTLLLPAPPPAPRPPPARLPASLRTPNSPYPSPVPCDAAHACPKGQRCCHGRGTSWGCCPFIQGSCCPDGRHCCPKWARCTARGWGCSPQRWDLPPPLKELL